MSTRRAARAITAVSSISRSAKTAGSTTDGTDGTSGGGLCPSFAQLRAPELIPEMVEGLRASYGVTVAGATTGVVHQMSWWRHVVHIASTVVLIAGCGGAAAPTAGALTITEPANGATVTTSSTTVKGTAPANAEVVHDIPALPDTRTVADAGGRWSLDVSLNNGQNVLTFRVGDDQKTAVQWLVNRAPGAATPTPVPTHTDDEMTALMRENITFVYKDESWYKSLRMDGDKLDIAVTDGSLFVNTRLADTAKGKETAATICSEIASVVFDDEAKPIGIIGVHVINGKVFLVDCRPA